MGVPKEKIRLPGRKVIDEIRGYCQQLGIQLFVDAGTTRGREATG